MAIEDYVEPEVAVAVAITAALFSPKVRGVLRKGLVYGVAGALTASEMAVTFASSVGKGLRQAVEETAANDDNTAADRPEPISTAPEGVAAHE